MREAPNIITFKIVSIWSDECFFDQLVVSGSMKWWRWSSQFLKLKSLVDGLAFFNLNILSPWNIVVIVIFFSLILFICHIYVSGIIYMKYCWLHWVLPNWLIIILKPNLPDPSMRKVKYMFGFSSNFVMPSLKVFKTSLCYLYCKSRFVLNFQCIHFLINVNWQNVHCHWSPLLTIKFLLYCKVCSNSCLIILYIE